MSRVPMHMAWVDPWSLTLVDKTPEKVLGLLDPLLITLSSLHVGLIPHVVMSFFKEGHAPSKYLIEDQVAPKHFLGSYPPRSKTKDQPMPYAWVPWTFPRPLGLSRGFNCLVLDQEPQSYTGVLSGVFTAWF